MGDMGDYWRDAKSHYKSQKQRHDNAVDRRGLGVMMTSFKEAGLIVMPEGSIADDKPRWRIYDKTGDWIDFWPHTGTFYQPQNQIRDSEYDWKKVGETAVKLLK